jgi:hypothetical protein
MLDLIYDFLDFNRIEALKELAAARTAIANAMRDGILEETNPRLR